MNLTSTKKAIPRKNGFALIVTLTLMVLLSTLALGLLSLASVELRTTAAGKHQAIARQNALFALQLAIGELQKNLGSDMRTSANADLVSAGTPNPHWAGAWNTEGGFRGWLVSGNENLPQPSDPADDVSPGDIPFEPGTQATVDTSSSTGYSFGGSPAARLVGENSVGSGGTPEQRFVFAPVVELTHPEGVAGRYAWWAGDEGVKANLAAPVLPLPAGGMAERLAFTAGSPNRGFPTMGGAWTSWLPEGNGAVLGSTDGKLVTRGQVPLANEDLLEEQREHFHDYSATSAGVLSDSKNGGLRKDLSIAFELPENLFKKTEFTRLLSAGDSPDAFVTDHGSSVKSGSAFKNRSTKTIANYRDPAFGPDQSYRGPTFDLLRDHYQLYRRLSQPFSAGASITAQIASPNVPDIGKAPWREPSNRGFPNHGDGAINDGDFAISDVGFDGKPSIRPLVTEFVPEVIHYAYTMSLQSYKVGGDPPGKSRVRLIVNPFIALYNPYNVVLESPPVQMHIARAEIAINLRYPNAPTSNKTGQFSLTDSRFDDNSHTNIAGMTYETVDHYVSDNGDPHIPAGGGAGIVLKPGEIKLYTITGGKPVDVDVKFRSGNPALYFQAIDPSDPAQLFSSGLYTELRYEGDNMNTPADPDNLPDRFLVADGDEFTVWVNNSAYVTQKHNVAGFPNPGNTFNIYFELIQKLVRPFSGEPVPATPKNWPEIREIRIFNQTYWQGEPLNNTPLTLTPNQIQGDISGPGGGQRYYVAQTNLFWKPAHSIEAGSDNNFSLATHNPRAPAQSTSHSGGQGPNSTRGPSTWTGNAERLDGSVPNFSPRFWGTGKTVQDGGLQQVTLWDIPRRPLTSIASFQHANVGRLWADPAFVIGNSYASPYVPADSLVRQSGGLGFWNFDDSYILNEALFDSYFFSGVNPGFDGSAWKNKLNDSAVRLGSADPTSIAPLQQQIDAWIQGEGELANPRMVFSTPTGTGDGGASKALDLAGRYTHDQTKLSGLDDIRPHNAIAAYALNNGAFNVNSTSVDAWRVTLAGLRGTTIDHLNASSLTTDTGDETVPFLGTTFPAADSGIGTDEALWNGFRRLTDKQIEDLAKAVVDGIKERARDSKHPFTTLADFVNRRKDSSKFNGSGVMQAAIDDSGLNNPADLSSQPVGPADANFVTNKHTPPETVTVNYANPDALAKSTIAGTPQWLTQADVLEAIGSQLSARSDTFTIRAYGESVNPQNGEILGRAWLEATVQRGTGFVDPADHPALPLSSLASDANRKYGRRFHVAAFRWLSPDEI